jgi:hypothetical protein
MHELQTRHVPDEKEQKNDQTALGTQEVL